MPIIHLGNTEMLILILILCPIIQISGALIGRKVPYKQLDYNMFIYRTRKWEREGKIYKKIWVHKWKGLLPDGAKYFRGDFTKKQLLSTDPEYISKFIKESCRAELVHWLGMVPFVIFFLLVPAYIAAILVFYSIVINLPCIIAQRYNRSRLISLYQSLTKKQNGAVSFSEG